MVIRRRIGGCSTRGAGKGMALLGFRYEKEGAGMSKLRVRRSEDHSRGTAGFGRRVETLQWET